MDRRHFSYSTPRGRWWADASLARLVLVLSAFLLVFGSLVLASTLSTSGSQQIPHALARSVLSPPGQTTAPALAQETQGIRQARAQQFTQPLWHGNTHLPEIALTFDDGPQPFFTPQILAVLQRFGVKATFFCIGRQVAIYPDLVRQESADGDLVEDHTWSHPNLNGLNAAAVYQQLATGEQAIEQATGTPPAFLRPPYGSFTFTVLTQAVRLRLSVVLWNVDPRDWSRPGTSTIVARVLSATTDGSIILLHDGGGNRSQTLAALPAIIGTLQERGFRFVTIQQMVDALA
jgi:peptidoglycan-N-acetylglucosamine deacetylase